MIFNIQRFSTHDGEGIRTLIFFKGCPLHCTWCSNPEGQAFGHEIMFDRRKCISCLECVKASRNGEFILSEEIPTPGPLTGMGFAPPVSPKATDSPPGRGWGWVTRSGRSSDSGTHPLPLPGGEFTASPCENLYLSAPGPSQEGNNTSLTLELGGISSDVVTIQREKIRNGLVFKEICPAKAITVVGEEKSVQEILAEVKKDLLFYENSGGGVTVSGGESFAQPDVLHELLQELKNLEVHIAVETCLHVPWEYLQNNANNIDVFLADLKHTDPEKFRKFTGGNLDLILSNLKHLEEIGATVIIRIPVIPGFNHTEAEMQCILDAAASLANVHEVHFIPYHASGSNKYTLLGRNYDPPLSSLAEDEVKQYIEYARTKGLRANIGG